jgi:hypothetical protein
MAAIIKVSVSAELTGLGDILKFLPKKYSGVNTPTLKLENRQIQATTNTDEVLELGGVSTVQMLIIICISNAVDIDLDYGSSFNVDLTLGVNEVAVIPAPAGVIRIKNNVADAVSTVDYIVTGT